MSAPSKRRERQLSKIKKDEEFKTERPVHDLGQPYTIQNYTAFKILMSSRLCAAWWNIITDCDEVYNYWEPMHFLLFGSGFQTWEYSPVYAIRSYFYLWIHSLPINFYKTFLNDNQIILFYLLRCILGFVSAVCEAYFYKGICRQFGNNIGRLTLCFLLFSAGMFISCTAFLPSSFSMYMTMLAMGAWYLGDNHYAIIAIAASAIIGWPFAAVLGIPIAVDIVIRRRRVKFFLLWGAVGLAAFLIPSVKKDSDLYGKLVIAPLNIILYNVFSEHGPDLYGTEPVSYYIINGFLNFNFIFIAALISLPFTVFISWYLGLSKLKIPLWLSLSPMYVWILIFFTQPHKEERFLFPIYPFFALCGAVCFDHFQRLMGSIMPKKPLLHYTEHTNWLAVITTIVFALLSFSRIVALYQGYHASMDIYVEMNKIASDPKIHTLSSDKQVNVCVGKEWYRFPSSFFMPSENWHLQFIQSEFKGLLPKPYEKGPHATSIIPTHMNDLNLEEPTRYINITKCHYLIDLDLESETNLEPRYSHSDSWKIIASFKFLDSRRSHRIFRAFYIPFLSAQYCTYVDYNLLKTTRTKRYRPRS